MNVQIYNRDMPRKTPLSKQDQAIAKRLVQLRKSCSLTREGWAMRSHVDTDVIERVELGRMALRYSDARALLPALLPGAASELYPVNPLWLSDEIGSMQLDWPFLLPHNEAAGLPERASFSEFTAKYYDLLMAILIDKTKVILPEPWLHTYFFHWAERREQLMGLIKGDKFLQDITVSSLKNSALTSIEAKRLLKEVKKVKAL